MKAAWSFTVLALLSLAATVEFSSYPQMPHLSPGLLIATSNVVLKSIEACLILILSATLIAGSYQIAKRRDGKRSRFISAMMWFAAALGVLTLLEVGINFDIYDHLHSHPNPWAGQVAGTLLGVVIAFSVASAIAWINVAIVTQGRRRQATDALT